MGFFKKKPDPISDRSRRLNAEIAALESQIKRLNAQVEETRLQPRLRSTAHPHLSAPAPAMHRTREPVFEPVDHQRMPGAVELETTPEHYNDLGVRKYDLAGAWRRIQSHFRGPATHNPKLVSYLAAGTIKGLRPLRYEKRVARNRFIGLFVILVLLLLGIAAVFFRNR